MEWRAVFLKSKQFPLYQQEFLKLLGDDPLATLLRRNVSPDK